MLGQDGPIPPDEMDVLDGLQQRIEEIEEKTAMNQPARGDALWRPKHDAQAGMCQRRVLCSDDAAMLACTGATQSFNAVQVQDCRCRCRCRCSGLSAVVAVQALH